MSWADRLDGLPGGELVVAGVADLAADRHTPHRLLVEVARRRLLALGVPVTGPPGDGAAELRLYQHLCNSGQPDPYSAYNALLRRLDKLIRALEARRTADAP